MSYILNIETASKNCSVSLAQNGEVLALKEVNDGSYSHGENLHVFIEEVLLTGQCVVNDLNAIAVSMGPGSYTGLRIGVSTAKGLCFSLDIPLIAIATLKSLAHSITIDSGVIIPMLDARRMEVYSAIYDTNYTQIREIQAEVIENTSFDTYLKKGPVYFLGDGAAKCKTLIQHKNANFLEGYFPSAKQMAALSHVKYKKNDIEDVAYFEPFYLKDFIITKAKN